MELEIGVTHSDLSLAESWFSCDASTGYLEDAIAGWGIWCKHHNLPSYSQDQKISHYLVDQEDLFPTFSSTAAQILHDNCLITESQTQKFNTSRNLSSSSSPPPPSENDTHAAAAKHDPAHRSCAPREPHENAASVSRGQRKRIAYPFEVVKPGGIEGETTLRDINDQMLMSPTKPIPHPVGNSVTHSCISTRGYGISGKEVAALTRIHTQGRGSITIIRTKG